jgi:prefoldin beta subunit
MQHIPPQLEQQLVQFQQIQKQAQTIAQQRLQFEIQLKEAEKALNELTKLGEKPEIYKSIGALLIKSDKEPIKKDLEEKKEALEVRIKTFKSQETKITEKLKTMKAEIESQLKSFTPAAG